MADNIFQQQVTPVKPKVLNGERVYVYVPRATSSTPGIASFLERDFGVDDGQVSLKWPEQMEIENLANPLNNIAKIKLLSDEFENTNNTSSVTNPVTGVTYSSNTAEVKLNRKNRNAFSRPDLVMLDSTSDFEATEVGEYTKYTLKKNNPLVQPSLIQVDTNDFVREGGIVKINWPFAHDGSGSSRTGNYGLVKIATDSAGGLKYSSNNDLEVDIFKVDKLVPIYSGNADTGFDISQYVSDGYATQDANGYAKVAITKEAVGLNKVANKAFNEYVYEDFGTSMKSSFDTKFNTKLDKTTWNTLFSDWNPPTIAKSTPQKWLTLLDEEDESIWESLTSLQTFLGYYENLDELTAAHPASRVVYGSTAFLLSSETYWAVRTKNVDYVIATDEDLPNFIATHSSTLQIGDTIGIVENDQVYEWDGTQAVLTANMVQYEWYNTEETTHEFVEMMETDASVYRADGVASAGSTGRWAQSDHRHPTDLTRLAVGTYNDTIVNVTTQFNNNVGDFHIQFNESATTNTLNIPYVRKGQVLHNWNGQTTFTDTEASSEHYWRGTSTELGNQLNDIPNNTVLMVEDGENATAENFTTDDSLNVQGITINTGTPTERFVIVNSDTDAQNIVNHLMTLTRTQLANGNYRYALANKTFGSAANKLIVTTNTGDLEVKAASGYTYAHPFIANADGTVGVATYSAKNVVVTSNSDTETGWGAGETNRLVITAGERTVSTLNTTSGKSKLIVGNGSGGVQESTLVANRYVYTSSTGELATISMGSGDAGKVLSVNTDGTPLLASLPTSLPTTVVTTAPSSANTNGLLTAILDADPGTYQDGVLYMW